MVDQETNLHPKNNPSINLKPNIVTGNIPDKAVTFKQLDEDLQNRIELNEANIGIITDDVTKNTADITKNTADITKNTEDIEKNTNNVASILQLIDIDNAKINPTTLENSISGSDDVIVDVDNDKLEIHLSDELRDTISTHTSTIATNTTDIAKNTEDITKNTADITKNTADITKNTKDIDKNTADIAKFANDVAGTYVTKIELYEALKRGEVSSEVEKVYTNEINYIAENVMPSGKVTKILGKTEKSENLLKHTHINGIKTTGINQWDEETELGIIDENGNLISSNTNIRSKNYTRVSPSANYYAKITTTGNVLIVFYDRNHIFIGIKTIFKVYADSVNQNNVFTTPSNCAYFKLSFENTYGTTYNHDICINFSNPTINGNYYPYEEEALNIEADLNGVGTASDEINVEEKKHYQRMGNYTFTGNENWTVENGYATCVISNLNGKLSSLNIIGEVSAISKYQIGASNTKVLAIFLDTTTYDTSAKINTLTTGKTIVYELAEPIVTDVEIENDGWLSNLVQDGSITQQVDTTDTTSLIAKEVDIAMNVVVDNQ